MTVGTRGIIYSMWVGHAVTSSAIQWKWFKVALTSSVSVTRRIWMLPRDSWIWLKISLSYGMASTMEQSSPRMWYHFFILMNYWWQDIPYRIAFRWSIMWSGGDKAVLTMSTTHTRMVLHANQVQSLATRFLSEIDFLQGLPPSSHGRKTGSMKWERLQKTYLLWSGGPCASAKNLFKNMSMFYSGIKLHRNRWG